MTRARIHLQGSLRELRGHGIPERGLCAGCCRRYDIWTIETYCCATPVAKGSSMMSRSIEKLFGKICRVLLACRAGRNSGKMRVKDNLKGDFSYLTQRLLKNFLFFILWLTYGELITQRLLIFIDLSHADVLFPLSLLSGCNSSVEHSCKIS